MNINQVSLKFLETIEFEVFCQLADLNLENIKSKILILNTHKDHNSNLGKFLETIQTKIREAEVDPSEFDTQCQKRKLDPQILETFEKLGIPLNEQNKLLQKQGLIDISDINNQKVAVDYVIDSTSVFTSFQAELSKLGIIFCSMSVAITNHSELVKKYLGSVVPFSDNFFASLNSATFSDGSFCYIPPFTRCPMELSTYFRINTAGTGQFERTLIIADVGSYVSYLEGCTAPQRSENQLHSAVVELIAHKDAEIKYSTVQNWYSGNQDGVGGIYNFVTKRGICLGSNSKISWTQVETGSAITWKYPSVILKGDNSSGEFYSVAITDNLQQADTGTKMIHVGKNTKSKIISKGITKGNSSNTYRGKVQFASSALGSKNFTKCDSMFLDIPDFIDETEISSLIHKFRSKE